MHKLVKLFGIKPVRQGIVAISFMQQGIAIAISDYTENNTLKLIRCDFIGSDSGKELQILGTMVSRLYLKNYDCNLVLASGQYRRINIEAPAVPEHEIAEAVRWKISDLIEFPPEKAVIDYYLVPPAQRNSNGKMLEVIASPCDQIVMQVKKCTQAGLTLKIIDIQETSLRNLATLQPENKRGIAILHLHETSGMIVVAKDAIIYLSRHLDTGYQKLALDCHVSGTNHPAIHEQNNLALEIQRSLDYVESYYDIPPISTLAIVPLPAYTQNLLGILNNNLGITARLIDIAAISANGLIVDDSTQSRCASVIGSTLRDMVAAP